MAEISEGGDLIEQARRIAGAYKRLTGRPLEITGEVAEYEAARLLGLKLAEARAPGYDALRGAERIQIKGRVLGPGAKPGQRLGSIKLDYPWETVPNHGSWHARSLRASARQSPGSVHKPA